ncbi:MULTISPECIES: UDP-N-acetylmuramoyl-L-alanine--D-glutamate ligase [unclassified Saccharibacter]|uniref:UDP-N-acetylmuramoyl-L-alanine--D-glutamate ligase n=1 Tax=unclassified Saccharibacter TaxID=2648722 RepID=UPI0019254551|nr:MULTISPECIES: UDP-N-acetylmuramoyl-L-alanine--D-glutamate ligase [unclassified Saccharibacter]
MMTSSLSLWPSQLLHGSHYAVCGLGRNGTAVVRALLDMGATVQAWDDTAPTLPEHPNLTLAPLTDLRAMDGLILSPGIPHRLPSPHPVAVLARSQHVPILSDAELLWQVARKAGSQARFVSVTGTNGKSTTTALLTHILTHAGIPTAAGGNLGTASLALPPLGDDGVYIIEMSSYMLERLENFHACCSIMLNLTPDHLERHGDMEGYAQAKAHVFDHMTKDDLAILGEDAPWNRTLRTSLKARHIPTLILNATEALSPDEAPMLPGRHNAQNSAACRAAARFLGVDDAVIIDAIRSFPGLAHRLQYVATIDGVAWINDSKATNAEASTHALAAYDRVIWIAGGTAKQGGIDSLAPVFSHIGYALLIGQDAPLLSETLKHHRIPHSIVHTLENAVAEAMKQAHQLDIPTVLLSPSCASFDQFRSFEERGERFAQLVHAYQDGQKG